MVIDPGILFKVFVDPTVNNINSVLMLLEYKSGTAGDLLQHIKTEYLVQLVKRINIVKILGAEKSAELALNVRGDQFSNLVLKQMALQWKPVKQKIDFEYVIDFVKNPNDYAFVKSLEILRKSRKTLFPTCLYTVMLLKKQQIMTGNECQEKIINLHNSIFLADRSAFLTVNALCGVVNINNNQFKRLITILNRMPISNLVNFEMCSDEQMCTMIDKLSCEDNFIGNCDMASHLPSFKNFLDEKPQVKKYLDNTRMMSSIMG